MVDAFDLPEDGGAIDAPTEAELEYFLEENEALKLENAALKKFAEVAREEIEAARLEWAQRASSAVKESVSRSMSVRSKSRRSNTSEAEELPPLTLENKHSILRQLSSLTAQQITAIKAKGEADMDNKQLELAIAEEQLNESKKQGYELKRAVALGSKTPGSTTSQVVMRHLESNLRNLESLSEKMNLRSHSMKRKLAQVEQDLKGMEGGGDGQLSTIDFDQLQIENQQLLERIESRNRELLALKQASGQTLQKLNHLKSLLSNLSTQNDWLKNQKSTRSDQISRIEAEIGNIIKDADKEQQVQVKLRRELKLGSAVPPVLEYVESVMKLETLNTEARNWGKRIEVQKMGLKQVQRRVRTMMSHSPMMAGAGDMMQITDNGAMYAPQGSKGYDGVGLGMDTPSADAAAKL